MLDIVIVNWNSAEMLETVVNSIINSTYKNLTLTIVDNNSEDNSLDCLSKYTFVNLIKNSKNQGFGKACNQGVLIQTNPYILFLNPDTILFEDTLEKSISFLDSHKEIAVLGCKQIDENGNTKISCSRFPNFIRIIYDIFGLSKILPKYFYSSTHMSDWDHNSSRFVDHVIGSFYLVRRNVFDIVGPFDENYFVYYEDLDLSKSIKNADYKIFYNSDIKIYHKGGGTSSSIKAARLFYSLQSRLFYYKKNFNKIKYSIIFILMISIEPLVRLIKTFLNLDMDDTRNTFKAYRLLLKKVFLTKNK